MNALLFVSIIVIVLMRRSSGFDMDEDFNSLPKLKVIEVKSLYNQIRTLPCRPQPRAFGARDLHLTKLFPAHEKLIPNNFILHRCDHMSGCCLKDNEVCGLHSSETVTVQLCANNTFTGETRIVNINMSNHMSCKCRKMQNNTNDAIPASLTSGEPSNKSNEYKILLYTATLFYFMKSRN